MEKRGGPRRKSRHVFRKSKNERGKLWITNYLRQFEIGERVVLKANPSYQRSLYHRRFHGSSGIIRGKSGKCYMVEIHDKNKLKNLIVHPIHLKKSE